MSECKSLWRFLHRLGVGLDSNLGGRRGREMITDIFNEPGTSWEVADGTLTIRRAEVDEPRERCIALIMGRAGQHEGLLQCDLEDGHKRPHRFMAPDATLRWWPVDLWPIPVWEDAISTPSNDPRWPESAFITETS